MLTFQYIHMIVELLKCDALFLRVLCDLCLVYSDFVSMTVFLK